MSIVVEMFEIQKDKVTANVAHLWGKVRLVLPRVLMDGYFDAREGKFWALYTSICSKSGDFDEYW